MFYKITKDMEPIVKVFICAPNPNINMEKPVENQEVNTNVGQMFKNFRYQAAQISIWIL
jgi:hypothetical protein